MDILTPEAVQVRVDAIRAIAGDYEAAHSMEDKLHQDVLWEIAMKNCEDPSACAYVASKTKEIKFQRLCA